MSLMDFVRAAKSRINEVNPEQLQGLLETTQDLLLVDVRESSEHEQGHIRGALLVPRGILEAAADPAYPKHLPELSSARDRPLVLYCATGGRSALAADTLQLMGYRNVSSLDGGYARWEQEGLPVAKEARYV
jgi:rhodanese-related sulfurtransferase